MKEKLQTIPFFVWLLPVFFVVHGFVEYLGFASFSNLVPLLLTYLASSTILFLLFLLIYKNKIKSGLMTFQLTAIWFFFGALFDFLKKYSPIAGLSKYSVLLSILGISALFVFFFLFFTKSNLKRITLYLNVLLLVFLVFEGSTALLNQGKTEKQLWRGAPNKASGHFPDTCRKPDIYLLLFDAFSSTYGIRELFGYDNSALDSFLQSRNFQLLPYSRSNYNGTSFSMASMFNMDYNYWLDTRQWITHKDYIRSVGLVYENETMRLLEKNNYEVRNYSIFDLESQASPADNYWRSLNASILSDGTLGTRIITQFWWWFNKHPQLSKFIPYFYFQDQLKNNTLCLELTINETSIKRKKPKFVYSHLLMPHAPYYFDKDGREIPFPEKNNTKWQEGPDNLYTSAVQYTNKVIQKLVDTIQHNTGGNAVIMLLGDHGYHCKIPDPKKAELTWNNLSAVFLPTREYSGYQVMKDSISNVNQFRILFNTLFDQQYPMLKDSFMLIRN